jgi:hypothetical protein
VQHGWLLVAFLFGVFALTLTACGSLIALGYSLLRGRGFFSGSIERDLRMQRLGSLFGILLLPSAIYMITIYLVVVHVVGYPR